MVSAGLRNLVYSPLVENTQKSTLGWDKESVTYAIEHKDKLTKFLRNLGKSNNKQVLSSIDVEEIYGMLIDQLYRSPDYDIDKATERSKSGETVSLEGYVHYQTKCCFCRFNTETYKRTNNIARDYINDDEGKELSPLDMVEDSASSMSFEEVMYNIEESCKQYQCHRYKYGIDLFMLLYVRLLTTIEGKGKTAYSEILETLGISKKDLAFTEAECSGEEIMQNLIACIVNTDQLKALRVIEKYVYSAGKIRQFTIQYS